MCEGRRGRRQEIGEMIEERGRKQERGETRRKARMRESLKGQGLETQRRGRKER